MRRPLTSRGTDWVCLPLAIIAALAAGNFALTYRPAVAGPEPPYRLDEGRQACMPVEYWIDGRFTSEENAAIRAAFTTWEDVHGSPVSFVYLGTRNAPTRATDDGHNTVLRSERALRHSAKGVIAMSVRSLASRASGQGRPRGYSDTDIVLDYGGQIPWSTNGIPGTQDLQSVVTHEVGHILGLDDVNDPGQVMYRFSNRGDTRRRELAWGDQMGLTAAYPHHPGRSEP